MKIVLMHMSLPFERMNQFITHSYIHNFKVVAPEKYAKLNFIEEKICSELFVFFIQGDSYILKAGFAGFQNPQTIWNFPQKDCLRTRKISLSVPET